MGKGRTNIYNSASGPPPPEALMGEAASVQFQQAEFTAGIPEADAALLFPTRIGNRSPPVCGHQSLSSNPAM